MKRSLFAILFALLLLLLLPASAFALPDTCIGDTAIYGGATSSVKPNVLIIFDSSGSMSGQVDVEKCEDDTDGDGVADVSFNGNDPDNCITVANPDQNDTDNDGLGDACDNDTTYPDTDGDGVTDNVDNCPTTANADQVDSDGNGTGDACQFITGDYNKNVNYTAGVTAKYCGNGQDLSWSAEICQRNAVYECSTANWNNGTCDKWDRVINDVNNADCKKWALKNKGRWQGKRKVRSNSCQKTNKAFNYATGNWIDWYYLSGGSARLDDSNMSLETYAAADAASSSATSAAGLVCITQQETKNQIARGVVSTLIDTTGGVNFGVMRFNSSDDGSRFITQSVSGSNYTSDIKDMDAIHTGTMTNREALLEVVNDIPAQDWTPLGESLFEAMRYLTGGQSAFTSGLTYTSPIQASCQLNYIIVITDGMSTKDRASVLRSICANGDCDGDGHEPGSFSNDGSDYLDDVAKYLFEEDLSDSFNGKQNALTYTIGFGLGGSNADAEQLLQDTAVNGGSKNAESASDYQTLTNVLSSIMTEILDADSAFVAPVVPTSPENKTYSGKRVYLGFFKPVLGNDWLGNLKKFGLDDHGNVVDKNGVIATDANGRFLTTATSYWSVNPDGANVDEGGIGDILSKRNLSSAPRKIYTYTGTNASLTHSSNQFVTNNGSLTNADLAVVDNAEKDLVINYVHGMDVYGSDPSLQRSWLLGDILHSKPAIQSYNNYLLAEEQDITKNKTIIFVGSNDGALHAFQDADGKELWSFIPPAILPNLKYLGNSTHEFFMDGTPVIYVYDHDKDGNIGPGPETAAGDVDPSGITDNGAHDKVIILIGMRRGGGMDELNPSAGRGFYYALDVTIPSTPKYLWGFDSTTLDGSGNVLFSELGETWADPTLGLIRLSGVDRIVAFIGAGYDNNEDLRFGDTQTFPDTTTATTSTVLATNDADYVTSPGTATQVNPRGRGVYVIELATLNSSKQPTLATSPTKLWEWVHTTARSTADPTNNPTYSFPSAVKPLDSDFDGYIDLFYVGDTGGNMWRFDIHNKANTNSWNGKKIFSANPSDQKISEENPTTAGRKIFYPPSVVLEGKYVGVYFGTGDRVHPLNKATLDRLYAVYDRNIYSYKYATSPATLVTEANLVNVTEDTLQVDPPPTPPSDLSTCLSSATNKSIECILQRLSSENYYGWFIKLDLDDGEKALANPLVFNEVAYFTTYTPNIQTNDPCQSGNLGVGRTYAVDYKTGEAVFNFDLTNDHEYDDSGNERANFGDGTAGLVLRRSDRFKTVGSGIPSGVVVVIREDGTSSTLVGCGGGICDGEAKDGGTTIPIYWLRE